MTQGQGPIPTPCPDDRLALAGRGAIDGAEWEALKAHLQACPECLATWTTARSFDGSGGAEPQDERLIHAAVRAALEATARRRPRRTSTWAWPSTSRWRPAFAAAAVVVLVGTFASAGIFVGLRALIARAPSAPDGGGERGGAHHVALRTAVRGPAAAVTPPSEASQPPELAPPAPASAPAPQDAPTPRRASALARPSPSLAATQPALPTRPSPQAELFARATAARRAGISGEAIALFEQLEAELPGTPEAIVARVSLGELLAEGGDARAALASFEGYLRAAPAGPLVPEALASRARLLAQLGRADEARRTWSDLARRFPRSPYLPRDVAGGRRAP